MSEQAFQIMIHDMRLVIFVMVILTVIINFLTGIFMCRNAVWRRDYDLALAILLGLYAIILAYLPNSYQFWNYLAIGWGILLFVFIFKLYFEDIIKNGSPWEILWMVLGILVIVLAVIIIPHIQLPEWMYEIPAI